MSSWVGNAGGRYRQRRLDVGAGPRLESRDHVIRELRYDEYREMLRAASRTLHVTMLLGTDKGL